MKCDACGNEVALAKVCPYCGHRVKGAEPGSGRKRQRPSGSFRGKVEEPGREGASSAGGPFVQLVRFFLEPRIAGWKKALAILALFYVVSPFDLMPGLALPVLGWLDDLALLTLAWRWMASALNALDRKP